MFSISVLMCWNGTFSPPSLPPVTVICNLRMQMSCHLQIMPPMIGETLLLYLDPTSTCGQPDCSANIIGQLLRHSPQPASGRSLIVYIREHPMPNLTLGGGREGVLRWGQAGHGWDCVQQVMCMRCVGQWRTLEPGSWFQPEQFLKTETDGVCRCGIEVVASKSPLFLPIQGHCWGLWRPAVDWGLSAKQAASWTLEDMQDFATGDVWADKVG